MRGSQSSGPRGASFSKAKRGLLPSPTKSTSLPRKSQPQSIKSADLSRTEKIGEPLAEMQTSVKHEVDSQAALAPLHELARNRGMNNIKEGTEEKEPLESGTVQVEKPRKPQVV